MGVREKQISDLIRAARDCRRLEEYKDAEEYYMRTIELMENTPSFAKTVFPSEVEYECKTMVYERYTINIKGRQRPLTSCRTQAMLKSYSQIHVRMFTTQFSCQYYLFSVSYSVDLHPKTYAGSMLGKGRQIILEKLPGSC